MNPIPVFYTPKQVVTDKVGYSPSARKPAEVVMSWLTNGFPIEIIEPLPAAVEDFERAHLPSFVRGVLAGKIPNGFGNKLASVAASLPWTTGSMLSAARHALATGGVAVSPTSGFHHAGYDSSEGFCTFNGLMVTALALQHERVGSLLRVGILDCDEHFGNGTVDIMRTLKVEGIRHYTFGDPKHRQPSGAAWLAELPKIVSSFSDCDVILYQAGADPHKDDPLGGHLQLTTEDLFQRDRIVFERAREMKIPIVWDLAGGYQTPLRKVLDVHDNTMLACVNVYAAV